MKQGYYRISQPLTAAILFINIFIQSCSNLTTVSVSMDARAIIDNISKVDIQASFEQLADNQLITENQLNFYSKVDQLQAGSERQEVLLIDKAEEREKAQQEAENTKENIKRVEEEKAENLAGLKGASNIDEKTISACLGELAVLPIEVVEKILTYVPYNKIKTDIKGNKIVTGIFAVRQINRLFYELTTGYSEPGLVGIEHRPNRHINLKACAINKNICFKDLNFTTLPSFLFYQFIRKVSNLPQKFWICLSETNVHTVRISGVPLGAAEAVELIKNLNTKVYTLEFVNNSFDKKHIGVGLGGVAKSLQGSNVCTVNISYNDIETEQAVEFTENLRDTNVHTINLSHNRIGSSGIVRFAKNLQGTYVHTLNLSYNNIGSAGIAEFAKNLQDTQVHTLDLGNNNIGNDEIVAFAKNLQGTDVHTLSLSNNNIVAVGIGEFAKNLQGTNVRTLNLSHNNIGAAGMGEFAKNLRGTNVRILNLSHNNIGAAYIGEFAKNLQRTKVHTIDLSDNNIGTAGAAGVLEFAKNLVGSKVSVINLSFNQINWNKAKYPTELMEFAQNLACTNVQKIDLTRSSNLLRRQDQQLILKQHPNIKWKL